MTRINYTNDNEEQINVTDNKWTNEEISWCLMTLNANDHHLAISCLNEGGNGARRQRKIDSKNGVRVILGWKKRGTVVSEVLGSLPLRWLKAFEPYLGKVFTETYVHVLLNWSFLRSNYNFRSVDRPFRRLEADWHDLSSREFTRGSVGHRKREWDFEGIIALMCVFYYNHIARVIILYTSCFYFY